MVLSKIPPDCPGERFLTYRQRDRQIYRPNETRIGRLAMSDTKPPSVYAETSAAAIATKSCFQWLEEKTNVLIEQFVDVTFNTSEVSHNRHKLFVTHTGVMDLSIDGKQHKHLLPGQGAFLAANSTYSAKSITACSFISILFPENYLLTLGDVSVNKSQWQSTIIERDVSLLGTMDLVDKEIAEQDHHSEVTLELLSHYVGIHLVRNYSTIPTQGLHPAGRPEICQIMCALEYIETNLTVETSIGEVIEQTQLTKHRFLQTFKEVTGQSPQQYIILRRLEFARHLLRRSELTLEQIAREAGFADQSHFSKAFRKQFGQSPAITRRQ